MAVKLLVNNIKKKIDIDYVSTIVSNSAQYINTNYIPNINSVFEFKYKPLGDRLFEFGNSQIRGYRNYDSKYLLSINSVDYLFSGCSYNNVHTIKIKNKSITIDEVETVKDSMIFNFDSTEPIAIFSDYSNTSFSKMMLYYFKISEGDKLIRDFRPCLDDNGVACLWDEVTQQYFYNLGTDNFTYSR